jgi:hypothetical protein
MLFEGQNSVFWQWFQSKGKLGDGVGAEGGA